LHIQGRQSAGQSVQGDQAAVMPDPPAVRPQPDGLSDENESEWDEMSVLETFARGQVLFDFDGNIPDIQCLPVKTDEIVEVSLRDDGGWTLARKQEKEGFIPTSYFKLLQ